MALRTFRDFAGRFEGDFFAAGVTDEGAWNGNVTTVINMSGR